MTELSLAAQAVDSFLRETIQAVRLDLTFTVSIQPQAEHPLVIEFAGRDTQLLLQDDGELMRALRYFAVIISGLDEQMPEPIRISVAPLTDKSQ